MADAKAKTINLLLYEGDLESVISIEDSSWNSDSAEIKRCTFTITQQGGKVKWLKKK